MQVSPDRSYGVCVCCVLAAAQKLMVIKIIRRNRKSHAAIYIYIMHSRRAHSTSSQLICIIMLVCGVHMHCALMQPSIVVQFDFI